MNFGRLYYNDFRDKKFPMRSVIPNISTRKYRYWYPNGAWLDQGNKPYCVGYGWTHWVEDGPVTHAPKIPNSKPKFDPDVLYHEAQKVDEWEGEDYDGTSVRAGAKILTKWGLIKGYYWATTVSDIILALLESGPVTVGTTWYEGMSFPEKDGKMSIRGMPQGGHCYVLDGINTTKKIFRVKNSWGRKWGKNGFGYIPIDEFRVLLVDYGEACLAVEVPDVNNKRD